jgi:hypothetical protein
MSTPPGVANSARAILRAAVEEPGLGIFTSAECAWLQIRDGAAFDVETYRDAVAGYKAFAARVHREAGAGISLAAELAGWAARQKPAKRRWVLEEVVPIIEEWVARVEAAYQQQPEGPS